MKKILAITSIRSDYDLLSPLYKLLHGDTEIDFRLLVWGTHLSHNYGYTVKYIKEDGFNILFEIESLINSDSIKSKLKSASIFLMNSVDIVAKFNPDVILYAGDREDVIIGGLLGTYLHVPTIHFYGGDHEKDGHEDTPIRHAASKLSTFHFVSCNQHKHRLIKMGENPKRIFNIGSVSLDKFKTFKELSLLDISKCFKLNELRDFAMVIYHPSPDPDERKNAGVVFENILKSLEENNLFPFVNYPNTDYGNEKIIEVIAKYSANKKFFFFKNLKRNIFLSIFKHSKFIIGNSSAGIYEAASIPIPVINVGKRQKKRMSGKNIMFCASNRYDINQCIAKALSNDFINSINGMKNPYGDGNSSIKAYNLIKKLNFEKFLYKTEDPLEVFQ